MDGRNSPVIIRYNKKKSLFSESDYPVHKIMQSRKDDMRSFDDGKQRYWMDGVQTQEVWYKAWSLTGH